MMDLANIAAILKQNHEARKTYFAKAESLLNLTLGELKVKCVSQSLHLTTSTRTFPNSNDGYVTASISVAVGNGRALLPLTFDVHVKLLTDGSFELKALDLVKMIRSQDELAAGIMEAMLRCDEVTTQVFMGR